MSVEVIVRCVHGMEWFCADEVSALFPESGAPTLSRREVKFKLPTVSPALFKLSIADDVYLLTGHVGETGTTKDVPDTLAARLVHLPWGRQIEEIRRLRSVSAAPPFDVVASLEGRRSYNRFAVENAVGRVLAPLIGGAYLQRTAAGREPGAPNLTVRLFIRGGTTVAALRLPDRPLHRRAYKQDTGPGSLHPPVAVALARLAEPSGGQSVRDPFCGDGTIPIETALAYPGVRVAASDIDPLRLQNTQRNMERAGARVILSVRDAGTLTGADRQVDAVITNPPWNLTVDGSGALARSLELFWHHVPDMLTDQGRLIVLADAELDVPGTLRRLGFRVALATRIRLVGRISEIVMAAPVDRPEATVPDGLRRWRERAIAAGVVTRSGF